MAIDGSTIVQSLLRFGASVHHYVWWNRAMTLGTRAVVLDGDRVFLIRHTYRPGWYLPGGGVDRGETAEAAVVRELREEGGLVCNGRPVLHGFFRNGHHDHVVCYIVRDFELGPHEPDWEIADAGFFPLDALPDGTTRASRARLAEVVNGEAISADW